MMKKCIYLFKHNKEPLTYASREHIFPAAIGGKIKLEKGFVSDQANNLFSQEFERDVSQNYFKMHRQFLKIGKRGKSSESALWKSSTVEVGEINKEYLLTNFINEKVNAIPQITFFIETSKTELKGLKTEGDAKDFIEKIKQFEMQENFLLNDIVDSRFEGKIIFGLHNKKWYLGIASKDIRNMAVSRISSFIESNITIEGITHVKAPATIDYKLVYKDQMFMRYCAKIAFNYLAYIKGQEHVLGEEYDIIRKFIVSGIGDMNDFQFIGSGVLEQIHGLVELGTHYILLSNSDLGLIAVINLFGQEVVIKLTDKKVELEEKHTGLFCNATSSNQEMNIIDYCGKRLKELS